MPVFGRREGPGMLIVVDDQRRTEQDHQDDCDSRDEPVWSVAFHVAVLGRQSGFPSLFELDYC